jgi:hypothetical protein
MGRVSLAELQPCAAALLLALDSDAKCANSALVKAS